MHAFAAYPSCQIMPPITTVPELLRESYSSLIIFSQDGVILGADTRATEGPIVCDKNCEKIHYMAPNIYCCGAGTAADTEAVTGTSYD